VFFLFPLFNPLDVGVVNPTLRGCCSDKTKVMGLKSHRCICWSKVCCSQLQSQCWICCSQLRSPLLKLLPTAQRLCWSITPHSPAHKSRCYLQCEKYFPIQKVWVFFWKGESLAFVIQLKAEGEPLPRKTSPNFSLRRPQHALSSWKGKRNYRFNCFVLFYP